MKKDWEIKSFEDCLDKVVYTKKVQRKDFLEAGEYPVISQEKDFINGYWNTAKDLFRVKKPVTIFGDHTQILKYVDFDFVLGADGVKILQPKDEIVPRYFYYCLQNINIGTLGYARHYRLLKESKLQFPKSLTEQRRITSVLDKAFTVISKAKENAQQNLSNSKQLFESYLEDIFSSKDNGWTDIILKDILVTQPRNGWSPPASNHSSKGTPVLTLSSVTGFNFHPEKIKFTSAKTEQYRHYWVKNDDFLITRSNTPELVGHVAIAEGILEPTIYPDLIMRMNSDTSKIVTKFLYYQMRTIAMRSEITGRAQGANPTMKKITKDAVQTLPISYPSLTQQGSIVRKLDQLLTETKKLETIYEQKLNDLEELKKSILQKAFNGEL